jgi:hypothetical protein
MRPQFGSAHFSEDALKDSVVIVFAKHGQSAIGSIEHMVRITSQVYSQGSSHTMDLSDQGRTKQWFLTPFLSP